MAKQDITNREEGGKMEKLPQGEYTIDGTTVRVGFLDQVVEFNMKDIEHCEVVRGVEPLSSYMLLEMKPHETVTRMIKFSIDENDNLYDLAQKILHNYKEGGQP